MKRLVASLLTAAVCLTLFAGCSGGTKPANANSAASEAKSGTTGAGVPTDKITLRFQWWGGDDRHKATNDAIKKFEQKYPYITIKAEYGGFDGMQDKVNTEKAGHMDAERRRRKYRPRLRIRLHRPGSRRQTP